MRSRKLLALLFCLITFPAIAGYMTLLGAGVGSIAPVVSWVSTTDPTFPSSSLTYSGPSLSTMFDSTGKLTYKPNQINDYSTTTTQWINATGATWSGNTLTANAGAGFHYKTRALGNPSTTSAIGLFDIKYVNNTWALVPFPDDAHLNYVNLQTGAFGTMSSGVTGVSSTLQANGSYRFVFKYSGAALSAIQAGVGFASADTVGSFTAAGTEQMIVYRGMVSAVTYEAAARSQDFIDTSGSAYYGPRIDYDPNTLAVKGLLIEEARTNSALQSNAFTTTWTVLGGLTTVTGSATTSPDGGTNGWKIQAGAGTNSFGVYQPVTYTAAAWTFSLYAKQGTIPNIIIDMNNGASAGANFNLNTGTIVFTDATVTSSIQNVGGGWYRCSITKTMTAAGGFPEVYLTNSNSANVRSWTAAGTENAYIFGAQLELGSSTTSYTPTAAASVTRVADVVQFTGAALAALQGSAGSAVVEHTSELTTQPGTLRLIGTTSSRALIYGLSDTSAASWNGSVSLNATIGSSGKFSTTARTAAAWSAAGRSIVANGGTVATDANAAFGGVSPAGAWLGSDGGTANWASGWYKSFAIYNQRLPDATLQAKSVVGASYAANDNGLRFADNDNLPIHWRVAL